MDTFNYSKAVLKLRVKLNISQEELGDMLGVSFSTVNRWENGHHEPTVLIKERLKVMFIKYDIDLSECEWYENKWY